MPHRELTEHALGLTWESGDGLSRTAHALVDGGRVWLVDPFEDEQALERAAALGEIAGVLQLFVAHNRDAEALAQRFGAPFLKLPEAVPDSPFSVLSLDLLVWKERALWWPERKGLVVPESVGAGGFYAVGPGPTGVHMMRRLLPPGQLRGYVPEHLLMGHGPPIHGSEATVALNEALDRSRRDIPNLMLKAPGRIRNMRRQS
jgi:hypothetical protein